MVDQYTWAKVHCYRARAIVEALPKVEKELLAQQIKHTTKAAGGVRETDPSHKPSCVQGSHMATSRNQEPPKLASKPPLVNKDPIDALSDDALQAHNLAQNWRATPMLSWFPKGLHLPWTSDGPLTLSIAPKYSLPLEHYKLFSVEHGPKCIRNTLR